MLTLESLSLDKKLSVFLAIKFAEKALPVWEAQHSEDKRPRAAIEAAQAWLNNPTVDASDADDAASDAAAVARAANAASHAAYNARAANAAADAAYNARAALAANAASDAAANAAADAAAACAARAARADYAAYAADSAAYALGKDKASFIHSVLMENAGVILEHMVKEEVAS